MLKYKLRAESIKKTDTKLNITEIWKKDGEYIIVCPFHGLHKGDSLSFERAEGFEILFQQSVTVKDVVDKDVFIVEEFPERLLNFVDGVTIAKKYHINASSKNFLYLKTADGYIHDFVTRRFAEDESGDSTYIREEVNADYSDYNKDAKRCAGDYFLYNSFFLYQAAGVNENNQYTFPNKWSNLDGKTIYIVPNQEILDYFAENPRMLGSQVNFDEDGRLMLNNCFVPVLLSGLDDRTSVMWAARTNKIAEIIAENAANLRFTAKDERFIVETEETSEMGLKCDFASPAVSVYKQAILVNMQNLFEQDFATNTIQEEMLKDKYLGYVKDKNKNGAIDYEKQCFVPVFEDGDIREISFKLRFRKRNCSCVLDERSGQYLYYTYDDWKTNDDLLWNNTPNGEADLLGYLGFTDDDVYYSKKKISKSFLRLSFYDTNDRRTQKLLFTSTIFLDSGKLYEKYVSNVRNGYEKDGRACAEAPDEYVYTENVGERIAMEFNCLNKYETTGSSEGFYIYLFPDIVENGEKTIYMKAEFNHAKYGYTIPMIYPETLVKNYVRGRAGQEYVDMKALFGDMYVPIKVKYNKDTRRYEWSCERATIDEDKMTLVLYEPKINKGGEMTVSPSTAEVVADGGTVQFTVQAPRNVSWEVTGDEGVTITPTEGIGRGTFNVEVPMNYPYVGDKTFNIVVSNGSEEETVTVHQAEVTDYVFGVSPSSINFTFRGEETQFTINDPNNIGWTISHRGAIDVPAPEHGTGNTVCNILAGANFDFKTLQAKVTVTDAKYGISYEINTTQDALPNRMSIEPSSGITFDWEGQYSQQITVHDPDSLGWEFYREDWDANFIGVDIDRGIGDSIVNLTAEENPETATRIQHLRVRETFTPYARIKVFSTVEQEPAQIRKVILVSGMSQIKINPEVFPGNYDLQWHITVQGAYHDYGGYYGVSLDPCYEGMENGWGYSSPDFSVEVDESDWGTSNVMATYELKASNGREELTFTDSTMLSIPVPQVGQTIPVSVKFDDINYGY